MFFPNTNYETPDKTLLLTAGGHDSWIWLKSLLFPGKTIKNHLQVSNLDAPLSEKMKSSLCHIFAYDSIKMLNLLMAEHISSRIESNNLSNLRLETKIHGWIEGWVPPDCMSIHPARECVRDPVPVGGQPQHAGDLNL